MNFSTYSSFNKRIVLLIIPIVCILGLDLRNAEHFYYLVKIVAIALIILTYRSLFPNGAKLSLICDLSLHEFKDGTDVMFLSGEFDMDWTTSGTVVVNEKSIIFIGDQSGGDNLVVAKHQALLTVPHMDLHANRARVVVVPDLKLLSIVFTPIDTVLPVSPPWTFLNKIFTVALPGRGYPR